MKKEKPKSNIAEAFALILLAILVTGSLCLQVFDSISILRTNTLLSTFQRIDTVRNDELQYNGTDNKLGSLKLGSMKEPSTTDSQSDPNLCTKWTTDCHSGAPGTCDVTCELDNAR